MQEGAVPVAAESAQRWGEVAAPRDDDALAEAVDLLEDTVNTPYLMNEELNFRIALWQGDMTALKVDALVNCNNEDLNERTGVSSSIFAAAGAQMEEACARLGGCSPGEAKATRGFRLPAKHVIHTVPPPWLDGVDAEATLERCYTSSFQAALQLHCGTIAFACIKNKDAPREQAAHVALRAVRRLLEQPSARGIQLVLFAMRPQASIGDAVTEPTPCISQRACMYPPAWPDLGPPCVVPLCTGRIRRDGIREFADPVLPALRFRGARCREVTATCPAEPSCPAAHGPIRWNGSGGREGAPRPSRELELELGSKPRPRRPHAAAKAARVEWRAEWPGWRCSSHRCARCSGFSGHFE